MSEFGGSESIFYECIRCGTQMSEAELEGRGGHIKCIQCGYKVLKKTKPPVVKRIRAV